MGPGEWIAAAVATGGVVGSLLAVWMRAGRILERVDRLVDDFESLDRTVKKHEHRLTKLEVQAGH